MADDQIKDAINQYKRALADRERVFGPDHLDTMRARGNLAAAYHSAGRMASAMQLYEQTCADYERVLGADHPDTLARRANLAHAYYSVGRLSDATTLLRDTVARCERTLPPGDPFTRDRAGEPDQHRGGLTARAPRPAGRDGPAPAAAGQRAVRLRRAAAWCVRCRLRRCR